MSFCQSLKTFLGNAIKCYDCSIDEGKVVDDCQGFNETAPTENCPQNVAYCLSVYKTSTYSSEEAEVAYWHNCDEEREENNFLELFCQVNGNGCHKFDDYEYGDYSVEDHYLCCCDTDL